MTQAVIRISTGAGLGKFIDNAIAEGLKSALTQRALTEKEKQSAMGGGDDGVDDVFGDSGEDRSSKTMDDESEKLRQGDIKPKDIVEKLNAIRSGRSFKDSAISGAMEEYIDSLAKPEKVALMAFLKGIAQIVTGEIDAQNAQEPSDKPAAVKMDKEDTPHVVHKKPNVVKSGGVKHGPPAEDTTAPSPITPKRR